MDREDIESLNSSPNSLINSFSFAFCKSKSEIRRLLSQGGLYVNEKRELSNRIIKLTEYDDKFNLLLRIGKNNYMVLKNNCRAEITKDNNEEKEIRIIFK